MFAENGQKGLSDLSLQDGRAVVCFLSVVKLVFLAIVFRCVFAVGERPVFMSGSRL